MHLVVFLLLALGWRALWHRPCTIVSVATCYYNISYMKWQFSRRNTAYLRFPKHNCSNYVFRLKNIDIMICFLYFSPTRYSFYYCFSLPVLVYKYMYGQCTCTSTWICSTNDISIPTVLSHESYRWRWPILSSWVPRQVGSWSS